MQGNLEDSRFIEKLGNKILLEDKINIRASDYHFENKRKYISGEIRRGKYAEKSHIAEINEIANGSQKDFNESDNK